MRYDPTTALRALREGPSDRSLVVAQLGQSLDGRIATPTGKSKYISGKAALRHLHRLRAAVDAVVVGVSTVVADDPLLTVRLVSGRSPTRVVVDPAGRMPSALRCLTEPGLSSATPLILIRADDAPRSDRMASVEAAPDEIRLPRREDGVIPPSAIIDALSARGLHRILIEGGARTLSHAMQDDCVDLLHVTVSPIILGSGAPGLNLPPIDELTEAVHPTAEVFAFDDGDALFACDLRRRRAATLDNPAAEAAE
ncbi:MAG: RibD family protein [Pseudomonadota bacterium]